jgi:hypothetical protein
MMMEKWNLWKKLRRPGHALYFMWRLRKCESNQRVKDGVPTSSPIFQTTD